MPSNQSVQIMLGFQADTSNAKKAIQDLNAQLNKIQSFSIDNLRISNDLADAADAAKVLQQNLQGAMNFNTGQLNISQFAQNLQKAGTSVTELSQKLLNAGSTGTQAFTSLSRAISAMDVPLKQTNSMINNMMTTLKNTAKWELSSNIVHGLESTFSSAISYAKSLNGALTDIRIVSGASVEQMAKFAVEANQAAKALGTTTKAYADAALIYYQQGDSAEMAAKKAEITLKATNAAFSANAQQMSEMLTATWNSYQAGADELEHMVDVMANLGAHTATSMEEIATSLQKVAATANTVGVSMEQMSAMISTVSSVTRQSAETIGTSMNTILSRIGGLKLGKTLEDGVDLNKYSKALASVGVQVLDAQGQLRSMGVVIDEVGEKWDQLSTAQQSALAQTVGGTRQYTSLMALFSNWDKYKENFDLTQNADGALQKMQDTYLESWEGASQRLKASIEGIWSELIDDQGMIKFTNSITAIVEQVQNLIQSFGGVSGILTQVGAIAVQVFSKNIAQGITSSITSIKTFVNSFKGLQLTDSKTGKQLQGKDYAARAFSMTTNERIYNQTANQALDQMGQARGKDENNFALQSQIDASQTLLEKKLQLQQVENDMSAAQKLNAQAQIAGLTAQAEQIQTLSQEYEDLNKELEKQERSVTTISELQAAAKSKHIGEITDTSSAKEVREAMSKEAIKIMKQASESNGLDQGKLFAGFNFDKIDKANTGIETLISHFRTLNQVETDIETTNAAFVDALNTSTQGPSKNVQNLTDRLNELKTNLQNKGADTTWVDQLSTKLKTAVDSGDSDKLSQAVQEISISLEDMGQKVHMSAETAFGILSNTLGISSQKLRELADSANLSEEQMIRLAQAVVQMQNSANKVNFSIDKIQKAVGNLTQAAGAMAGAFSSAFNLLSNWDSANAASKLTGVVSTITQGVNAIFQGASLGSQVGGIWGAVIGAGVGLASTAIGAITGYNEQQEKARVARLEEANKSNATRNNQTKDEINNTQSLIKTYNELFERYKAGEDVQNELAASAQKLADAYNITGASVAILTGNYDKFNQQVRETLSLTSQIDTAQNNLNRAKDANDNLKVQTSTINNPYHNAKYGQDVMNEAIIQTVTEQNWEELLKNTSLTTSKDFWKMIGDLYTGYFNSESFKVIQDNGLNNEFAVSEEERQEYLNLEWGWKAIGQLAKKIGATEPSNASMLASGSKAWNNLQHIGEAVLQNNRIGDDLGSSLQFLFDHNKSNANGTIADNLHVGSEAYNNLVIGLSELDLFYASSYENVNKMSQEIKDANYNAEKIFENSEGLYDQETDTFLFDQKDMETTVATYRKYQKWQESLTKYRKSLKGNNEYTKYIDDLLTGIDQILKQDDLSEVVENYEQAKQQLEELTTTQNVIKDTVGKNEITTTFSEYLEFEQALIKAINENPDLDPTGELKTLKDQSQEDSEEYKAAVERVKKQLVSNYTSFDDYLTMSSAISESFTDNQQSQIIQYIDKHHIKSINGKFIHTLMSIFSTQTDVILDNYTTMLQDALQEAPTETLKLDKYNQQVSAKGSLKKEMTFEDSQTIYDTYFKDLDNADEAWTQFIESNYTERGKMLEDFVKTAHQEAVAEAEEIARIQQDSANDIVSRVKKLYDIDLNEDTWVADAISYWEEFQTYLNSIANPMEGQPGHYKLKDNIDMTGIPQHWAQFLQEGYIDSVFNDWLKQQNGATETILGKKNGEFFSKYNEESKFANHAALETFIQDYYDWLAATEQVDSAEAVVKYMQLIGEAADDAATKVSKLASAFNSLPKSEDEAEDLLEIFRENEIGGQWKQRVLTDGEVRNAGFFPKQQLRYIPMTAEEFANLSQEELNDYTIQAAKKELEDITDPFKRKQAESEIKTMEKTQRDLITTDEKQRLSELQSEYQSLSKIDITKMPKEGTSAYKALQQALKSVNIEMSKFNSMSDMDKNAAFYKAQRQSLQEQLTTAQQIADAYKTHDFTVGMDLSDKDADFIKEYQDWYNLYKQVIDLENQISDSFTNETDSRIAILNKEAEAIETRMTNSQKEADKIQKQAEVFSNAVETGDLTATQKVNLTDADIAKWDSLTTAEERAAFAAQKWSEALIAGQDAFSETQGLITNAQTMMQNLANQFNMNQVYASTVGSQKISKDFATSFNNPMIAKAYQEAVNKHTITEGTTTQIQGIQAIIAELQLMGEEGQKSQKLIEAAGIDAMNNIYKTAVEKEQAAAQEAIQAWKEAYDTIADIRKSLYNKEDIGEIFLDPDKSAALAKSLGVSVQEAYGMYLNGSIKPENLKQNSFDINAAIQQRALSTFGFANTASGRDFNKFRERYFAQNKTTGQTIDDFYDQHTDALLRLGQDYFKGFDQFFGLAPDSWKDYFDAIIKGTVTEDMQTTLQKWNETVAQGILVQEKAYKMQDDITAAEQERDALIKESTKTQQEAETKASEYSDLASIASSIFSGNGENLAASYLNGQDANKVLDELNQTLKTSYDDIEDVSILDWGKAADKWSSLSATETEKAAEASEAIVGFWDQFIANLKSLNASSTTIAQAEEARDAANTTATDMRNKANAAKQDSEYKSIEQWSNYAGVDEKEFIKLAQTFEDLDQSTKILKEDTDEYRSLLYKLTAIAKRSAQGAEEIGKHYKKNKKEIESLAKATGDLTDEQKATLNTMRDNLAQTFNVEKKYLTDDFIKEHVKDYKELAEGSEKAAKKIADDLKNNILGDKKNQKIKIGAELDVDNVKDGFSTVSDIIDNFVNTYGDVPIGAHIDTGPALEGLNALAEAGVLTADEITAALEAIGWQPEIEYTVLNAEGKQIATTTGKIKVGDSFMTASGDIETFAEGMVLVPHIKSATKTHTPPSIASQAKKGSSGGSSGGGGGGGSQIKHKEYKGDEEIEHYHQINRQIEYQERLLKKVSLLKNQRYGLGYLSALRKENAELLKSIELTRRRAGPEHAGYWLDYYKNILAENGGVFGEITGNLDYQPYMFGRLDDYNRHVDEYNARADAINAGLSSETQEHLDEWFDDYEKGWQKTIDAIDGYEEALDIILDAEVDVMEKLNEISANLKEIATYKMEFRMELNEADMKRIDFLIKRYGDYLDLQDESFEQMEKNANFLMENLSYVEESFEELYGYYHTKLQVFDKEAEYIDSLHDVDDLLADDMRLLNDADYVDGLFTTRDALMENVEQLWELRKQMLEVYGNTIDLAADKLSKFTDTLEHHINVYDSYLEILELTQDGIHFDEDIQILQGAYNSALTEVNILREHLDALLGQRETLLKQMENPIYANNEKIQKDFEALQTRIEEIEDQLLETTQTTLDKAKTMFDKTLEHAQYKMRKLGDSFSTDLDWLSTQWDFWIAEQDQYVDRITQVYEIDKLVRDIETAIADTRNKSNQTELKALEDEIQLKSENNALTEYDIEMMRLSYELLLARQNLENAQDAKDTVRLTRDDNGNYIYQYTADEDKVAEAQQKYNDVLYEMNQTTKERYRELVQNGIDIQREFIDQYTQIMEDMTLSTQEKEQRVQELFEHYGNLLEGIDIQMDNVLRNMGENQLAWTNEMGINLMDTADTAAENISNLTGGTRTQLNILFNDARTDAETWKTAILEIINEVSKSWSNYCSQLTTVQDTSKTTLDDMIKQIIEYGKQANVAQDQASILTKTMDDTLTTLTKMNAEWLVMDTRMQSVIDSMLKMDEKMSEEQREVAGKEYDDWVQPVESTTAETIYNYEPQPAAPAGGGGSTCQTSCGTGCTGSCWKANAGSSSTIYVDSNASSGSASYTTTASANTVQQIYSNVGSAIIGDSVDQYGTVLQSNGACQECQFTCKNFCTDTCKGDCGGDCTNRCRDTCSTRCQDGCKNGCKGTEIMKAATGGLGNYTGLAWIDGTPERPEYILNAEQTQEMFGILNDHTVSNLLNTMTMATQAMLAGLGLTAGNISTSSLTNTANAQNNTYITAEFPNATDHNEIELALENLMNSTAQSVNSLLS